MGRDQPQPLGSLAVGEWDPCRSRTAHSRGDARHHGKGHPSLCQCSHFLAATAEDEGVAPLETNHQQALPGMLDQQRGDFLLGDVVRPGGLAHIDQHGLGSCQGQDGRTDQAIMHHHIGGLQQAQRLERQQVRIARASTHQSHMARGRCGSMVQHLADGCLDGGRIKGCDKSRMVQQAVPGGAAHPGISKPLDLGAQHAKPCCERIEKGRQARFELGLETPRQGWGQACCGDGYLQGTTFHHRRKGKRGAGPIIHHIDQDASCGTPCRYLVVEGVVVAGCHHQHHAIEILGREQSVAMECFPTGHQMPGVMAELRSHQRDPGAGCQQLAGLARCHRTATDHQAWSLVKLQVDGQFGPDGGHVPSAVVMANG